MITSSLISCLKWLVTISNSFSSLTIICEDSGLADALSTALFCMDYNEGYNLIKQIGGIEVIWIDKNNNVFYTEGLELKVYEWLRKKKFLLL